MLNRIASCAILLIFTAAAAGQTAEPVGAPDPFAVTKGSSFSAARSPRANRVRMIPSSVASDVQEAISVIVGNHVSGAKIRVGDVTRSSIDSMLRSLDPHSNFYNPLEYNELIGDQKSEYFGTGSTIISHARSGKLDTFVVSTMPGSVSQRAGLRFGDRIVAVDGKLVSGLSSLEIRNMIRGPRGTSVRVSFERGGATFVAELRRDRVPQPTVTNAFLLPGGVGLIEMGEGFSLTSYAEFETAFRELKYAGMHSLILDLRGNPGGVLDQSIKIAEKFLPVGATIVSQRGRNAVDTRVWKSANRLPEKMPVVVLVDGGSASASEVIAGALQDNDRALIVGEKTFGKGLVQSVLDLPGGTGLTLTTARYYTPSGRSIQRDFERVGSYDYYNNRISSAGDQEARVAAYTVTKRRVYGGDGIAPDEFARGEEATARRIQLLDPIFHFSKQLIDRQGPAAEVSEEVLAEFGRFASTEFQVTSSDLNSEADFIRSRIIYNLVLARKGPQAAREAQLRSDPQVAAAVRWLPKAAVFIRSDPAKALSIK